MTQSSKMNANRANIMHFAFLVALLTLLSAIMLQQAYAEPSGSIIASNTTVTPAVLPAASSATAGGSFTTMVLNATVQTMRWKAYVGNVTGSFVLQDASNFSIYNWGITSVAGEIYASRNSSIDWSTIQCASNSTVTSEQTQLNMSGLKEDSINKTFNTSTHKSFYVGTRLIGSSSCRAIATYVNGTRQTVSESASFQEALLQDGSTRLVYATLLENKARSYNNASLDFQMIVAESDINPVPSTYYFWVELG